MVRQWAEFQASKHEGDETAPRVKVEIASEGADVVEKGGAPPQRLPNALVGGIGQAETGMQEKGQQVECEQEAGEMLLAMAKVVLEMIALVLECVVVLVLRLPTRPTGAHNRRHILIAEPVVGDEAVVVEQFRAADPPVKLAVNVGHEQLTPVDAEGVIAVAQQQIVGLAIGPSLMPPLALAVPALADTLVPQPQPR